MWGYVLGYIGLIFIIAFIILIATFRTKSYRLYQNKIYTVIRDFFGEIVSIINTDEGEIPQNDPRELKIIKGEKVYKIQTWSGATYYSVAVKIDHQKYFLSYCRWNYFSNKVNCNVFFVFKKKGQEIRVMDEEITQKVEEKYRSGGGK